MEQKIKQDAIQVGENIRRLRKARNIGQLELAVKLQLKDVPMTREALGKIERGKQHIKFSQLRAIKEILNASYDDLFTEEYKKY